MCYESPRFAQTCSCDADPVLDGWEVHREVFHELAALKVTL
jgi:hypothetical protein